MLLHFGRATDSGGRSSVPMDGNAVGKKKSVGKQLLREAASVFSFSQHSQLILLDEGGPEVGVVGAAFVELRVRLISAVLLKPVKRVGKESV